MRSVITSYSIHYTKLYEHCGRKTAKSYAQGYCYPCFRKLPQCDSCIVSPEKCHVITSYSIHYTKLYERLQEQTAVEREYLLAAPVIAQALQGQISLASYMAFLGQAYHHVIV